MIALVDCNAFYASCEQIFRPDLRNKPVVVLSNNDGCIVAQSKEARALGIPSFEPYFKHKNFLEQHQVAVFSSNYELYGDISRRVMLTLQSFTPQLEAYSIDEAFLDLSGFSNLRKYGLNIKKTIWRHQRIPVCVGIAANKTLAKLANHIAKKSNKLDGVCLIDDLFSWAKVFQKIPVQEVWGVGKKLAAKLNHIGIYSVEDLRQQNAQHLQMQFSIDLARTVKELKGETCLALETSRPVKQQIFCSRMFGKRVTDKRDILEATADYAAKACEQLRKQKSLCQRVYVKLQTSSHINKKYAQSSSLPLIQASNDTRHIIRLACQIAEALYQEGYSYAKVSVGLQDLCPESELQKDLFTATQSERSTKLMQVCDSINQRYGKGTAFIAQQGIQQEWQMLRSMRSPCYTTRLSDIPIIKL